MKAVKEFIDFLFKKEQEAIYAGNKKEEFEKYNALATEIKSYMNDITVGFGLPILTSPKPDVFYRETPYPNPRYLFKISEYENAHYGRIWACYVSIAKPSEDIRKISECFIVAEIKGELKIIADMIVASDAKEWRHVGGDEDKSLRIRNLGTPVKVERYIEPISTDEWSLKEYLKNS
ncbi:hypothetical protein E6C50_13270 [Flavobacterium supellecticarium]|uniref:Uncharacterized protein n=1 Tax=Flavobacterium supellecticarium TaxID=2565924 RepID=A0A4S3ZU61_9FLAO|nr:hypothetical protein [Flavobacterium supellecticarium]THF49205.1 hypothetical protein E6C50_13270 [Flavobacterium supellecticarium]